MNLLNKISNWYFSNTILPCWVILLIDSIIIFVSSIVAGSVFIQCPDTLDFGVLCLISLVITIVFACFFTLFHTYSGIIRYSSFVDLQRIIFSMCIAIVSVWGIFYIGQYLLNLNIQYLTSWKELGLIFLLGTLFIWLERVIVKSMYDLFRVNDKTKLVFIYGVNKGGVSLAKNIRNQEPQKYKVAGFVSPDPSYAKLWLMGTRVYQDDELLVDIMQKSGTNMLFVSPLQNEHFREQSVLIDELIKCGIKIMMLPPAEEWGGKSDLHQEQLQEVDIEDLLPREKIDVDMEGISVALKNKSVLITGAAGSIGLEIVRQVASFAPKELILIDQAESPMHDVRLLLSRQFPHVKSWTIVTSIAKADRMEYIFKNHQPDYVFHAAAYKHVPMMEDNPCEAVQNNIYGTRVIADLSVKYGVKKFVMVSTDKAVNPTNVMGCSKRICEIYCQSLNNAIQEGKVIGSTQFVTTRFGNVLGSNGSVIPLFKQQIAKGGPLTVTHSDIVRFFMLIPEACKLVLEAGVKGKGGEIFVFDMGKPVKIVDLAQRMINLSGAHNIQIKFTGLRDGEKLYEEVLNDKENTKPSFNPKIRIASVREYDYETVCINEERLLQASYDYDDMEVVKIMKEIVPEYKSQHSVYEILDK